METPERGVCGGGGGGLLIQYNTLKRFPVIYFYIQINPQHFFDPNTQLLGQKTEKTLFEV